MGIAKFVLIAEARVVYSIVSESQGRWISGTLQLPVFLNRVEEFLSPSTVVLTVKSTLIDLCRYPLVILWRVDVVKELSKIIDVNVVVDIVEGVDLGDVGLCVRHFIFVHVKDFVILGRERCV